MRTLLACCIAVYSMAFLGCSREVAVDQNVNLETARKVEQAVAAAPTRAMLVDLQTKAFDALKRNDPAFWEGHLHEKYVGFIDGKRVDRAGTLAMMSERKCEISSFAFSDEKMVPVGTDAIVLTAKTTIDGICSGKKVPSPVVTGTLYVRAVDTWKAAFYNEVAIVGADSAAPPAKKIEPKPAVSDGDLDALSASLFAVEKRIWAEWKAKNRSQLADLLTEDATRVDALGTVLVGKQAVVNSRIIPKCNINAADPIGPTGSEVSPVIGILTYRGTASGTCDGKPLSDFWGTTIYQKEGGEWKAVYIFETPA